MTGHLLRPCKSKAAFEALPQKDGRNLKLDLSACGKLLGDIGYQEVCDARVLIIMKKEIEVTIYPSGKLLLKTDFKEHAESVMNEIYGVILPK
jgi:hypothetical protein